MSARTECIWATRFINTREGWDIWCYHVDGCEACKKDLEEFYSHQEET